MDTLVLFTCLSFNWWTHSLNRISHKKQVSFYSYSSNQRNLSPKETGTKPSLHLVPAPNQNSSFYSHTHTHTHDFVNIWEQKQILGGKDGAIRVIAHDRFCIGKLKGYLPSKPQGFHTPPQDQHQEVNFSQILTEIRKGKKTEKVAGFCEIKFVQFKFSLGICFD